MEIKHAEHELKPCPECNRKLGIQQRRAGNKFSTERKPVRAYCACGYMSETYATIDELIKAVNSRKG